MLNELPSKKSLYARLAASRARVPSGTDRGQTFVLSAMLMIGMIGATGLALDFGVASVKHRSAQKAADAAALAGAQQLPGPWGLATTAARDQAGLNGYSNGAGVSVTVSSPPTSGIHSGDSNSVEVSITENVATSFVRVFNINTVPVTVRAVATSAGGPPPCGLYVMNPTASGALGNNGNGVTTVNGGCVYVNSTSSSAGMLTGNSIVSSDGNFVRGGCTEGPNADFVPPCSGNTTAQSDPLGGIPIPSGVPLGTACGGTPPSCSNTSIAPGVYNSLSASGSNTLTLSAGTYVITGDLTNSGNGIVAGSGVTLYFACPSATAPYWRNCNAGEAGGRFNLVGNGGFSLTAPTGGTYDGLLLMYDRNNTSPLAMRGNGGVGPETVGTIYAKSASVSVDGNGSAFSSLIVADKFVANGNGTLTINYDPGDQYGAVLTGRSSLTE